MFKTKPATPPPQPVGSAAVVPARSPAPAPRLSATVTNAMTPEEKQAAIVAEKDRLYAWSQRNDLQSLSNILGDLTSPDKEIRMAAIDAAKQFDDTNAIPVLKAMAANAVDNDEAIAMLEAVDFISLPTVTWVRKNANEVRSPEQQQALDELAAKAKARREAYMRSRAGQQDAPPADPPANPPN